MSKQKKTHIDLFSGIGGLTLACEWAGIKTEVFCEKDKRCQEFLRRTYPGVPIVPDIREFDGTKWRGRFLLTAGVPCQPASRAGKQRGKDDDRWLWPEALRVISEAKPSWCLLENPPGIGDVGLEGILAGLEIEGYEVRVFGIPACAVNSPQLRNRYWIVGHTRCEHGKRRPMREESVSTTQGEWNRAKHSHLGASENRMADRFGPGLEEPTGKREDVKPECETVERGALCDLANTSAQRSGIRTEQNGQASQGWTQTVNGGRGDLGKPNSAGHEQGDQTAETLGHGYSIESTNLWSRSVWLHCADGKVRRAPDDSFGVVDGLHRSVLAGLGNSIVPQVAYQIIKAIVEIDGANRDD